MNKATQKFTYFLVGIAVPVAVGLMWFRTDWFRRGSKRREIIERSQQIAVEDSFPASDPPSAW
jgi:putative copper export protein